MLGAGDEAADDVAASIVARQQEAARLAYAPALAGADDLLLASDNVARAERLAQRGSVREAWEFVRDEAAEMNEALPDTPTTAADWHRVQSAIGRLVSWERKRPGVTKTNAGRLEDKWKDTRREILEMLDGPEGATHGYREARKAFADDAAVLDALEAGQTFLTRNRVRSAREVRELSDSERESYAVGVMQAIRAKMSEIDPGHDKTKGVLNQPVILEQLRALLPNDREFRRIRAALLREQAMYRTRAKVTGGSPTAGTMLDAQDFSGAGRGARLVEGAMTAGQLMTGAPVAPMAMQGAGRKALEHINSRAEGLVGPVADRVGQRLQLRPGTPEFEAFLTRLVQLEALQRRQAGRQATRSSGLGFVGGGAVAPGSEPTDERRSR